MSLFAILVLAVSVSIDAFAVSVGGALGDRTGRKWRNALHAALFFGGFQVMMPLIGYFAATQLAGLVEVLDHWLAFVLLGIVGGKMIYEGARGESGEAEAESGENGNGGDADFFAPKALFMPAVATSLDALAVGAGLAFARSPILLPAAAMGVVTAAASIVGVLLGRKLGKLAGERVMLMVGGTAIVLIGLKILLEHLTAA
ncbi:manganese efflux pump MntP family protein [uncultured Victivallis sp.]|uniref:manganese efflux pump MntP n=1 Tax=uncultured Victivallis sp. TaxID=354118 RepID=UPI0025F22F87|nr:manganese efflux pump MntP family protein [uncultured Victivallis sp.]